MITTKKQLGAAMLLFVLFFAFSSSVMMFMLNRTMYLDLSDFNRMKDAKRAYFASEGAVEDIVYRQLYGTFSLNTTESVTLGGITAYATSTYDSPSDSYRIEGKATHRSVTRKALATMTVGNGNSFNYGLQAGNGGITLSNNSDIYGNIYANGPVVGSGSAEVFGDIVSSGAVGLVQTIHATGSIYANTINRIDADKDAYYNIQIGTNAQNPVGGTRYTPAANQPAVSLPISTTSIQEWKDAVINNGTVISAASPACSTGTYTINTSMTIGYLKVECNLDIRKTGAGITVTLDGPVWVTGNLSFTQGPTMRVDPALGRFSTQFIVDNPSNRTTSSKISVRNSTNFNGSGDSRSYIMLLSMNESASLGGAEVAVDLGQSANGDVLAYAGSGLISIGQNIDLREVTAYKINVDNGSSVTYESGLANLLFTSGPGGGYTLDSWTQSQ